MISTRILGTASLLPGPPLSTTSLASEALRGASPSDIEAKTGIQSRHRIEPGTPVTELAARTLKSALDAASLDPRDLRRILFVSSTGGDQLIPSGASEVAHALGLTGSCDGFDISNSCMGFLSALDTGARSVQTGLGPVGIVVAETLSRFTTPEDPRPYLVLGDAIAAVVLGPGRPGEGILGSAFGVDRTLGDSTRLLNPGVTGARQHIEFMASNRELTDVALATLMKTAKSALAEAGLAISRVEWILPHQPNGRMLERIMSALDPEAPPDRPSRFVPVVQSIGSVGAASIPVSLDTLLRTRPVQRGDHILMAAIGAGVAYGAVVYRVAP